MMPLVIAHIKGSQGPSTITSSFNPRANEDFGILCIITLAINETTHEGRSLQYYIYCIFNNNAQSTAALHRYYICLACVGRTLHTPARFVLLVLATAKPAGPATRIALF